MRLRKDNEDVHITFDWYELTSLYRKLVDNPGLAKRGVLRDWVGPNGEWNKKSGWVGANSKKILERLENGYKFENTVDPETLPSVAYDRPRARYTDDPEGEFSYDLYIQGETEHFLTKPKRKMLGGIRLNCQYDFNANTSWETIAQYGQWIGSVIQNLQMKGYDLEISLYSRTTGAYPGVDQAYFYIRVSKFGERVMPHDWSAAFSPGGYRHLCFLSYMWPDQVSDLRITTGLGRAVGDEWNIEWDPKAREINVSANSMGSKFPVEEMTKRFESWRG